MGFEEFRRQRAPLTTEPAVTIQKRGNFSMNPAAFKALGEPEAIQFLYDAENKLVALRKTPPDSEFAYIVRPLSKGQSTWLVSGMAFTVYYGIDTSIARRWVARADEEGMLILDLKEPGQEIVSNRERGAQKKALADANGTQAQLPGPVSNGSPTAAPQPSPQPTLTPPGGGSVS